MPTISQRVRAAARRTFGLTPDATDAGSPDSTVGAVTGDGAAGVPPAGPEPDAASRQDAASEAAPTLAASASAETVFTGPSGAPVWASSAGPFPPDRAFDFGTIDGSREIDKEHFEGYLEQSVGEELARTRIAEADAEAELWRGREAAALGASAAVVAAEAAVAAAEAEADRTEALATARVNRAEGDRDRLTAEAETVEASVRTLKGGRGSVLFALLYTAAAVVFIVGDIGIAQSTVADGLELTGWHGIVFAVGLGLLSVLLKPVYDRLVEDPYHDGEPTLFRRVITTVSVLTLGALLVLGYFRSESYVAGKNATRAVSASEQLDGEIEALSSDPSLTPAVRDSLIAGLEAEQSAAGERQEEATASLTKSVWGRAAFVLSGVLFAVAGAVCLGIGLKHASDFYYLRHISTRRARRLREEAETAQRSASAVVRPGSDRSAIPGLRAVAEARRAEAAAAWPVDVCREGLTAALAQRAEAITGASAARGEKLVHLYRDGYELGLKNPADYESDAKGGDGTPRRPPIMRPFVELRRAISRQSFGQAPPDPSVN